MNIVATDRGNINKFFHRGNIIAPSNIVTAFNLITVGAKVIDHSKFGKVLGEAIYHYDFDDGPCPGQAKIKLPTPDQVSGVPHPKEYVSAGVGLRTLGCPDYIIRSYRGKIKLFLRRYCAIPVTSCSVIVHEREAYLEDPQVINDEHEHKRVADSAVTHVLVAVLAPDSPLPPDRLVANIAEGNREAERWDVKTITELAKASDEYYTKYCVVSD